MSFDLRTVLVAALIGLVIWKGPDLLRAGARLILTISQATIWLVGIGVTVIFFFIGGPTGEELLSLAATAIVSWVVGKLKPKKGGK